MRLSWAEHSEVIISLHVMIWELVGGSKEKFWYLYVYSHTCVYKHTHTHLFLRQSLLVSYTGLQLTLWSMILNFWFPCFPIPTTGIIGMYQWAQLMLFSEIAIADKHTMMFQWVRTPLLLVWKKKLACQTWWNMSFSGGSLSSRPALSTQWVTGQPKLHRKTLSWKKKKLANSLNFLVLFCFGEIVY